MATGNQTVSHPSVTLCDSRGCDHTASHCVLRKSADSLVFCLVHCVSLKKK